MRVSFILYPFAFILVILLAACAAAAPTPEQIQVALQVDGETLNVELPLGSSARSALETAGVELGLLDRSEPPLDSALLDGDTIRLIRVTEEFEVEQEELPFERRTIQNESMTQGEQRLLQEGANGLAEITYRVVYEDGEQVSRTKVRSVVVEEPVEEILMVGVQAPSGSIAITGRLAFISAGNAWLIEGGTGLRRPIATSGDLDGRVLAISPDGAWLLFSRESAFEGRINELWVASLDEDNPREIDLGVGDVVHYAGWVPDQPARVAFSTAEAADGPPGWQANNDLRVFDIRAAGGLSAARTLLGARADSLYSWWGSTYAWSPDGELAYSQPDAVGLVAGGLDPLLELLSYQTEAEWAWMPGIAWSPDGEAIYTVDHVETAGLATQERSPRFDLIAIDVENGGVDTLVENVGMFANPQASPLFAAGGHWVAYLQALNPGQSDVSAYQLMVSEPNGENARLLFPPSGSTGLEPQQVAWSPLPENDDGGLSIAVVYHGNLWIVDAAGGAISQVTADGSVTRAAWGR